jgi:hypothetical protein
VLPWFEQAKKVPEKGTVYLVLIVTKSDADFIIIPRLAHSPPLYGFSFFKQVLVQRDQIAAMSKGRVVPHNIVDSHNLEGVSGPG